MKIIFKKKIPIELVDTLGIYPGMELRISCHSLTDNGVDVITPIFKSQSREWHLETLTIPRKYFLVIP